MDAPNATADIGLIGLAVMGENLVLNMESHGYTVAVFNRTTSKVDDFVDGRGKGKKIVGCHTVEELVAALEAAAQGHDHGQGRAGRSTQVIDELAPLLEPGDILIDGGNTHYPDTTRRTRALKEKGLLFVGTGVSGGEEGALKGPSIMPGGDPEAWPHVKPIFQAIAAKVDDGTPCCDWVGPEGAGPLRQDGPQRHRVRRHAADLRGLPPAERRCSAWTPTALHEVFARWNTGPLDSYLIEITRDIFGYTRPRDRQADGRPDPRHRRPEGDRQVDRHLGPRPGRPADPDRRGRLRPLPLGPEGRARRRREGPRRARTPTFTGNPQAFVDDVEMALYASKIISYAQGYALMNAMAKESGWEINNGGVALMWRGGCIIRSAFLGKIKEAFDRDPNLANLLLDPYFTARDRPRPGRLAAGLRRGRHPRHPAAGDDLGPGLLRRLPHATACRPTCSRPSATTSAPTPTSASTSPAASSSTPTGPAGAARRPRRRTTSDGAPSPTDSRPVVATASGRRPKAAYRSIELIVARSALRMGTPPRPNPQADQSSMRPRTG